LSLVANMENVPEDPLQLKTLTISLWMEFRQQSRRTRLQFGVVLTTHCKDFHKRKNIAHTLILNLGAYATILRRFMKRKTCAVVWVHDFVLLRKYRITVQ